MTPDLPAVEVAIVDKTNAFRKAHKLGALRRNAKLDAAARAFARFMARTSEFSHTADGREPAERIKAAGYSYCLVAENLAFHADTMPLYDVHKLGVAANDQYGNLSVVNMINADDELKKIGS